MTVSYTHEVATAAKGFISVGNFWGLLLKWHGSIYQLVWPDLCVYICLYYSINIPYRLIIAHRPENDRIKSNFHSFVKYSRDASGAIPLQFILGFYVSQIMTRWWEQYMTCPWPDSLAVTVATTIRGHDERGRLMRRTIMRYINCSLVMVLTMISPQARTRFPQLEDLVDAGFFVPHERLIIEHLNEKTAGPKYYVPIVWAGAVAVKARREGRIKDDFALYNIIKEICKYRSLLIDLLSYDWVCIPLVYTQVATLATYIYFFSALISKQFIDEPDEVDIYVPVLLFFEFIFLLGWLKVAETLINPFGEDDDDFEVNWLIDRNITVSYLIVDQMYDEFPEIIKDVFWHEKIPDALMYTPDALKFKTDGMGGGSAAMYEEKDKMDHATLGVPTPNASTNLRYSLFRAVAKSTLGNINADNSGEKGGYTKKESFLTPEFVNQLMEHGKAPEYKDSYENIQEIKSVKSKVLAPTSVSKEGHNH